MLDFKIASGTKLVKLGLFVALLGLTGCISVKVDERTAFQPEKRKVTPATSIAELNARMADRFKGGVDEGRWRLDPEPSGGMRVTFLEEFVRKYPRQILHPPTVITNGFIGEGAGRVAWTYFRFPNTGALQPATQRPLVVHCAGNAGDRYNSGPDYAAKALHWADVLVFDYPGYGDTPGPTSAAAFEGMSKGVSDYVTSISNDRKLVFWGHSLGGFVCSQLAAQTPTSNGLILETTAPNAAAVARAWTPNYARLFVSTEVAPSLASYDVVEASSRVKGPILVLGATKDEVLPVSLARQVGDGLKSRGVNVTYQEFPLANHTSVPSQPLFSQTLDAFFQNLEKPNP
jgi:pimeloyl-ACP methyl ester carboxylesterase